MENEERIPYFFIIRASYENRKGSASYENTGSKNLDWLENLKKYKDQKIVVIYSYDSKYFWKIAKIITLLSKIFYVSLAQENIL